MMFSVTFMCCEYRYVSLMTRVQTIQRDTASCNSAFTGSKYAVCIQLIALELFVNSNMCAPCPNFWIVM